MSSSERRGIQPREVFSTVRTVAWVDPTDTCGCRRMGALGLREVLAGAPIIHSTPWFLLALLEGRNHRVTGDISGHSLHQLWYHCVIGVAGEESFMCVWKDAKRIWRILEDAEVSLGHVHHWNYPSFSQSLEISLFDLDHSL